MSKTEVKPVKTWNHRIMVSEYKGEKLFEIHEVHYTNGIPTSYAASSVGVHGDGLKGIKWVLSKMTECCDKPILWKGEKWPQEYKPKKRKGNYQCDICNGWTNPPWTRGDGDYKHCNCNPKKLKKLS